MGSGQSRNWEKGLMKSRLRELRGKMALEEFTQHCGLPSKSSLDRWEKGESEPKASDLTKIGKACRVSVDWLLGLTEDKITAARHIGQENIQAAPPSEQHCPRCIEKDEVKRICRKRWHRGDHVPRLPLVPAVEGIMRHRIGVKGRQGMNEQTVRKVREGRAYLRACDDGTTYSIIALWPLSFY
jgi:transcriptional regulator with XRE-family HTH domain